MRHKRKTDSTRDAELVKLLACRDEAAAALDACQKKETELVEKKARYLAEMPRIEADALSAGKSRRVALDRFIAGEITQGELDEAKARAAGAAMAVSDARELLDAVERALAKIPSEVRAATDVFIDAERALYRYLLGGLKREIIEAVGTPVLRAYAIYLKASGGAGGVAFSGFVPGIFAELAPNGHIDREKIAVVQAEIEAELSGLNASSPTSAGG